MELNDKKVVEIFLGLILIVAVIILIFTFTKPTSAQSQTNSQPSSVIINSYNTNSYNKITYETEPSKIYYKKTYKTYDDDYTKYSSHSKKLTETGIFGNKITRYIVYVTNDGSRGKYFSVKFYLENCHSDDETELLTRYIAPDETEKFTYIDISDKYCDWKYSIN